jgi:enoyl-CoA hydratase/carnithine racemase
MANPPIRVERRGDVAWCALDRPPLNLLDPSVIGGLRETFETLGVDPSVRVAVLTGGEARVFTAGMNVQFLGGLGAGEAKAFITRLHEAIETVHRAPFPVIAGIHGACLGAGFELVLACDLRIASADASLGLPEVRVGVPSVIEAALLPALVGPGRAAEILFTGRPVSAEQALAWGLVNRVVAREALTSEIGELVDAILACAPTAIRLQKELIIRWRHTDLGTAIAYGINAFAAAYATGEPQEGARAFLERRRPRFVAPP